MQGAHGVARALEICEKLFGDTYAAYFTGLQSGTLSSAHLARMTADLARLSIPLGDMTRELPKVRLAFQTLARIADTVRHGIFSEDAGAPQPDLELRRCETREKAAGDIAAGIDALLRSMDLSAKTLQTRELALNTAAMATNTRLAAVNERSARFRNSALSGALILLAFAEANASWGMPLSYGAAGLLLVNVGISGYMWYRNRRASLAGDAPSGTSAGESTAAAASPGRRL